MIKALIVEDEVLARLGLHQLVDWGVLGYTLLEDAKDGIEALEIIERDRPQVLLLDLNLPKVNGLQIQKHIADHNLDVRIVVISCNEDFTVVKEAMRLGAYDFLRKLNLTREDLTRVLLKCKNEIETPKNRVEASTPARMLRYEEISEYPGRAEYGEGYDQVLCVAVPGGASMRERAAQRLSKYLEGQHVAHLILLREQQPPVVLLKRQSAPALETCQQQMERLMDAPVYIGACDGAINGPRALHQNTVLAEQILLPAYYGRQDRLAVYAQRLHRHEKCPFDFGEDRQRFQSALSAFSEEALMFAIEALFERIEGQEYIAVSVLRRMFMDLLGVYSASAQALGGSLEEIEMGGENCHYQTLMTLESLRAIRSWFEDFSRAFINFYFIRYKTSRSDILRKAMEYIQERLCEPIQLVNAAQHIGVSEAYLSSLFTKEIGQSFIKFVNERKIHSAKQLLAQGMLVYEVSDRMGFENCTYFSKLFKRYTNTTPEAYRKEYGSAPAPDGQP